jgi:Ca2+/Na+ antiporter
MLASVVFSMFDSGLPLIALAGLAMYVASKALADALLAGRPKMSGRLALGQWVPIAVVAIASVAGDRPAIAMGLIFSSSIACLCLGTGAVAVLGFFPETSTARRSWTMVLPAGFLVFLAGFQGALSPWIAAVLLLQGLVVLLLWNNLQRIPGSPVPVIPVGRGIGFRIAQFSLAVYIACVGAWFAIHGVERISSGSEFASPGLLTATLLSPLLVLPIIGGGTELAQRNQASTAVDAQLGVVLLNICLLLPLVVLGYYLRQWIMQRVIHHPVSSTFPVALDLKAFPFPLGVWRVDVVMLIALGLFVMPVALGRWVLTRQQGLGMMVGYAVYLALAIKFQGYVLYGVR